MATFSDYGQVAGNTATTSGTTLVLTFNIDLPRNTLLVMSLGYDNPASASNPTVTVPDVGGAAWNLRHTATSSGVTTTAGSGIWHATRSLRTTEAIPSGTTLTITWSSAVVSRAAYIRAFAGIRDSLRASAVTAISSTGAPTATTAGNPLQPDDLVIGTFTFESSGGTGDSDTVNGSWSSLSGGAQTANTGTALTSVMTGMQWKRPTVSASQTYNPTSSVSGDSAVAVMAFIPDGGAFVIAHTGASATTSGTSLTATVVQAVPVGHTLIAAMTWDNNGASSPIAGSPPAGWTLILQEFTTSGTSGGGVNLAVWAHQSGAISGGTFTFTVATAVVSRALAMVEFVGVAPLAQFDNSQSWNGTSASRSMGPLSGSNYAGQTGDIWIGVGADETNVAPARAGDLAATAITAIANTGTVLTSAALRVSYSIKTAGETTNAWSFTRTADGVDIGFRMPQAPEPVGSSRSTTWDTDARVTTTRQTPWHTRAAVATSRITTWNVIAALTQVSTTRQTTWHTLASVGSSRITTWHTRALVTTTRQTMWHVMFRVATTRLTTWNTLALVSATRITTWTALARVTTTRVTTWDALLAVATSRITTWNVAGGLAQVGTSRVTTWHALAVASATRVTTWSVLTPVATSRVTTWSVLTSVSSSRITTWVVRARITTSRVTTWHTYARVTSTRVTTWHVLVAVSSSRSTTWNVAALFLGVPTGLIATPVSISQIDLSWNSVVDATAYDVERDGSVIAMDVPTTSYSDTGLATSSTHTYRVRAVQVV